MKISLVIPAYNEEKYIGACLESVQRYGSELFEVIVVNNASTDRTAEIAKSFSGVMVVDETKKGLPYARNRGLAEASGDIIAYIDADARMPARWVAIIKYQFEHDRNLVSLSGPYRFYDGSFFVRTAVWFYDIFLMWPSYFFTRCVAIGGNFVTRRNVFTEMGGFNESIAFYGDDTDVVRRLAKKGTTRFYGKFYMYTSARRLRGQGMLKTAYYYGINFASVIKTGKPVTHEHQDIR